MSSKFSSDRYRKSHSANGAENPPTFATSRPAPRPLGASTPRPFLGMVAGGVWGFCQKNRLLSGHETGIPSQMNNKTRATMRFFSNLLIHITFVRLALRAGGATRGVRKRVTDDLVGFLTNTPPKVCADHPFHKSFFFSLLFFLEAPGPGWG